MTNGLALAKVTQPVDPEGKGRIKVSFLGEGGIETDWIPMMTGFGGADYGSFFLPQQNDLAVVGFVAADTNQPCVLGFLWNGGIKPPVEKAKQADVRIIRTKQGKLLRFDDSGSGGIAIEDEKQNRVVIDTEANAISVESGGDVTISAKGTLTLKAAQVVVQQGEGAVKLSLTGEGAQLAGGESLKLSATMIDLN
jgi:uncharacterized protein involved in type VI secretion and phage assembly